MASLSRQIKKILLKETNFRYHRPGNGDHEVWCDPDTGVKLIIDHSINSRHTANGITKDAGLGKRF